MQACRGELNHSRTSDLETRKFTHAERVEAERRTDRHHRDADSPSKEQDALQFAVSRLC
jgi:hypothetical protein